MTVPLVGELTVLQFLLNSPTKHLTVRLCKNLLPAAMEHVLLTDLVECDFAGYAAAVDPPFDPVSITDDNLAEGISYPMVWVAGPAIVPQIITGIYLTIREGAGPESLLWVDRVGLGYNMCTPGQSFGRKIRMLVANRAA